MPLVKACCSSSLPCPLCAGMLPPGGFTPQPSRVSAEADQPVVPHVHLLEVGRDICLSSITRIPSFLAVTCQRPWSAPSLPSEPVCSHASRVPGQLGAPQLPPRAVGSGSLLLGPAEDPCTGVSGVRANGPELWPEAGFQERWQQRNTRWEAAGDQVLLARKWKEKSSALSVQS